MAGPGVDVSRISRRQAAAGAGLSRDWGAWQGSRQGKVADKVADRPGAAHRIRSSEQAAWQRSSIRRGPSRRLPHRAATRYSRGLARTARPPTSPAVARRRPRAAGAGSWAAGDVLGGSLSPARAQSVCKGIGPGDRNLNQTAGALCCFNDAGRGLRHVWPQSARESNGAASGSNSSAHEAVAAASWHPPVRPWLVKRSP